MALMTPPMVDMALSTKEQAEITQPDPPKYPYGLCISLCQDELDKLNIDQADVEIGSTLHLFCLAKVTSKSCSDNEISGPTCRVELQIVSIAAEDEDEENETAAAKMKKLYK